MKTILIALAVFAAVAVGGYVVYKAVNNPNSNINKGQQIDVNNLNIPRY